MEDRREKSREISTEYILRRSEGVAMMMHLLHHGLRGWARGACSGEKKRNNHRVCTVQRRAQELLAVALFSGKL